jgi:hypothetical protein
MRQLADRAWHQGYGIEAVAVLADLVDWFRRPAIRRRAG